MALRVYKYRGKTIEELKEMNFNDFLELLPSRQRRSLKRGFTEAQQALMKKIDKGKKNIKTHVRDMVVLPKMVGLTISIYNGKEFVPVNIQPEHVGLYFGELVLTRKKANHSKTGVSTKKKVTIRK